MLYSKEIVFLSMPVPARCSITDAISKMSSKAVRVFFFF